MMKKLISLLLAAFLLFPTMPVFAARHHYIVDAVAAGLIRHEIKVEVTRHLEGQGMRDARYLGRRYLRDIEQRTNRKISDVQKKHILEAIKQKHFGKLKASEKVKHTLEYNSARNSMIADWERNTGQTWPKYTGENNPRPTKIGQRYDLHHIIPKENGGPNVWWNSHPAASPSEHQAGIHASGSALRQLQDLIK